VFASLSLKIRPDCTPTLDPVAIARGYRMAGVEAGAISAAPDAHTPSRERVAHMQKTRLVRPLAVVMAIFGIVLSTAFASPRSSVDLNGGWRFRQRMPATATPAEWRPATVPGDVHLDLLANKQIQEPFYRDNEAKLQWIQDADWEYRTTITATPAMLNREHEVLTLSSKIQTEVATSISKTQRDFFLREQLRAMGANYVAFTSNTAWWLDLYPELSRYVDANSALVAKTSQFTIYLFNPKSE